MSNSPIGTGNKDEEIGAAARLDIISNMPLSQNLIGESSLQGF